jgi:3-hydroxyisobutyrate dehydrogenase
MDYALQIGIISADDTGPAIALRIAAKGQRVAFYATPGAPRPPAAAQIEIVSTPTDIAFGCDVVIMAIDDTAELHRVLIGTKDRIGIAAELAPGSVIVDLGARPPRETLALLGITGTRAIAIVDAAVIGQLGENRESAVTVLAGGYPDAIDTAMPALKCLGPVESTGPLGSAHTAAALMGYMEAAHHIAREEAASVGRALGLGPETLAQVLDRSGVASTFLQAGNILQMARRTELAGALARTNGVRGEVIEFTRQKLAACSNESR